MRFLCLFAPLALVAGTASADPAPAEKPAAAKCKPTVMGRGLERKVVCVFEQEVVVSQSAPKPKVVYVTRGGKDVTGRPKADDRFTGLSRRLR